MFATIISFISWGRYGEFDDKRRTGTGLAVHIDPAAMIFNDTVHQTQAQTGSFAFFLGRKKRFANSAYIASGDPDARIGYRHHNLVVLLMGTNPDYMMTGIVGGFFLFIDRIAGIGTGNRRCRSAA